ncbi:hypothetical protein AMECASPLE_036791, partial [Ameca splendens]
MYKKGCWTCFKTMGYFNKNTQNGDVALEQVYFTHLRTTDGDVALEQVVPLIGFTNTGV